MAKAKDGQTSFYEVDSVTLWFYIKSKIDEDKKINMEILNLEHSSRAIIFDENELSNGWNTLDIKDIFHLPQHEHDTYNKTLKITFLVKCLFECKITVSNDDFSYENDNDQIIIGNSPSKKAILSVNLLDKLENDSQNSGRKKRHVQNENNELESASDYTANLCKNNYPNSMRECCLITYFVDFNALKWSWILSPSGFLANYCSGKCNEKKSKLTFG